MTLSVSGGHGAVERINRFLRRIITGRYPHQQQQENNHPKQNSKRFEQENTKTQQQKTNKTIQADDRRTPHPKVKEFDGRSIDLL